jgi:predicted nucleic acid-binding protein
VGVASGVVDANVVLRVLTGEPQALADQATELLAAAADRGVEAVLAPLTIAEIIYVLEKVYGWPRRAVVERLLEIVDAEVFLVMEREVVRRALAWYRDTAALDFPDAYVASVALARGDGLVLSLDRDLRRLPGVRVAASAAEL